MDTTLQDPLVGQVLDGRYRIEARIAVGGMATVYRAVDTRLDRVLALKVMHPTLATDAAFVERFIREAKSVARLNHPNVVGVSDQGTDGTYVYLAMEYVAGCTLRDVLRERGALQPRIALEVAEPVLAALGAAHLAGLVHRGIKPENVLIGDDGRVKVADFGLVRTVDAATSTSTGAVLGTVSYLAPEQIEHGTADTRADVYACGVVLYEMLTGAKPHTRHHPGPGAVPAVARGRPGALAQRAGASPGTLRDLVAEATARDPEQRPAGAVELLGRLRAARSGLTDAQLDVAPPRAKAGTLDAPVPRAGSGPDDRTSVIPRAAAARGTATRRQPAPSPVASGAAVDGEDELNRTSVLRPRLLDERPVNDDPPSGAHRGHGAAAGLRRRARHLVHQLRPVHPRAGRAEHEAGRGREEGAGGGPRRQDQARLQQRGGQGAGHLHPPREQRPHPKHRNGQPHHLARYGDGRGAERGGHVAGGRQEEDRGRRAQPRQGDQAVQRGDPARRRASAPSRRPVRNGARTRQWRSR